MKRKKLYWFSLVTGLLTLGVGIGIFLVWWMGRVLFALNLVTLELYGFMWILISVPIALVGLITSTIVILANIKESRKAVIPLIILLTNIPAVYVILVLESKISERVYFKVTNKSERNYHHVKLTSDSFNYDLGKLKADGSIVDYYIPTYTARNNRSVPEIEEVTLELSTETETFELKMPYAMKGWCDRLVLSDSLTLNSVGSTVK